MKMGVTPTMRIASKLSIAAAAGMLAFSTIAFAQSKPVPFDGKKFFDEIAAKGFKAPAGFDGNKFFEEIASKGFSDKNKLDGNKFFAEIAAKGFSVPAGFDGRKFFDEQMKIGGQNMPPMVDMTK